MILRAEKQLKKALDEVTLPLFVAICVTRSTTSFWIPAMLQLGEETKPKLTVFLRLFDLVISRDHAQDHRYQHYISDGRNAFPI